jgi:hypothetical protein
MFYDLPHNICEKCNVHCLEYDFVYLFGVWCIHMHACVCILCADNTQDLSNAH